MAIRIPQDILLKSPIEHMNFLRELAVAVNSLLAASGLLPDGDYGDITVSGAGATMTIDGGVVTNSKLATMPATTLKGNATAAVAAPQDIPPAGVISMLGLAAIATSGSASDLDTGTVPDARLQPSLAELERRYLLLLQRHITLFNDIPPGLEDDVPLALAQ